MSSSASPAARQILARSGGATFTQEAPSALPTLVGVPGQISAASDRSKAILADGITPGGIPLALSADLLKPVASGKKAVEQGVADDLLTGVFSKTLKSLLYPTYDNRASALGVIGNGTDEAAALSAAATSIASSNRGGTLTLDNFNGYTVGSTISLPSGQQWRGTGGVTGFRSTVANGPALVLTGNSASVQNFPFYAQGGGIGTSSVGVQIGTGPEHSGMGLADVLLDGGFGTGVDIQSGVVGKLRNVTVYNSLVYGIRHRNITDSDAGDDTWTGVTVNQPKGTGSLVRFESGGGMKVFGFKGLGGTIGWDSALPDGTNTSVFQFVGNSIEGSTVAGMKFSRTGTTGSLGNFSIVGNEFGGSPIGLWFSDASHTRGVVSGNTFGTINGGPAIRLDNGANDIVVGRNSQYDNTPILIQDNRTSPSKERGFLDRADTVPARSYDASADSSGWTTAYTITMPAFRGVSVHVVLEGLVQGQGVVVRDEEFLLTGGATTTSAVTFKAKSSTVSGATGLFFRVDTTTTPGKALIQYRASSTNGFDGTVTILPLGKMVSLSR